MPFEFRKMIYRADLRAEPEKLFVFGDNLERVGLGGQAYEMRGEPNAIGLPTKVSPGMASGDFFRDEDLAVLAFATVYDLERLFSHAAQGGTIVWPADGIGTGLSQLPVRAPRIARFYEVMLRALVLLAGGSLADIPS